MEVWSRRSGDEVLDLPARSPACQSLVRRAGAPAKAGRTPFVVQFRGSKSMTRIKFLLSLVHDNI